MMTDYKYKEVDKIVFGMISPQEIEKSSAVKVVTAELYDKEGYPVDGGLMDIRLGVIDPGLRCKTCGSKLKECIGHFGHIELARPVIHVCYATKIYDMLRTTCKECNRLLLDEESITKYHALWQKFKNEKNFEYLRKLAKVAAAKAKLAKKCPHCGAKPLVLKVEKPTTFMEGEKRISPIEVRARLSKIPEKDVQLLGMDPMHARPEWMILTVLLIPPVTMRPSITLETGERSEDDLTHKLGDIVRINQRLFENINAGAPEIIVEDLWDLLQYHVTTYFDNTITHIPPARHRSGQALKTLTERIKSKEGRFRHNLAGKRVNFAARTVISPDPKIEFNEVGIPQSVAMELTIPERVTEWNKEWLLSLVKNGRKEYPGANYVIAPDGKKRKITKETQEQLLAEIKEGYIVERQIIDGDIALFNRQPSLHRMSIMCHKIKVLPGRSFRLNPSVCVSPDTKVSLTTGIQRPIDELRNCWKESELQTYDWKKKAVRSTKIKKFWGLKPEEYNTKCYEIITKETQRRVVATADHPFYSNTGIKGAGDLKCGDKVVANPLDTPSYQEKEKKVIREKEILRHAPQKTYMKHTLKVLRDMKLNEISLMDQRSMILARLVGHVFGDGTCILKDHVARLICRGDIADLESMQQDLRNLGFTPEKIYTKTSNGIIQTVSGKILKVRGSGNEFEIRHKPLVLLLKALGAPNGDKVTQVYTVPSWIKNAPLHIQREFIGAYLGSELTTPRIREISKTNFRALAFKIAKVEKKHAYPLIRDLTKMLKRFGVAISEVREEPGNKRKNGSTSTIMECRMSSNTAMRNFFGKIGYIYAQKKDNIARRAYQYLLLKEKSIKERKEKYQKLHALRKKGYTFKRIAEKLQMSVHMLENWMYRNKTASLGTVFPTFDRWVEEHARGLSNGLVWETIDKIKETYCPFVYDVTTIAETHNFFANGFLTKNCNPYNADFDGDEMNLHIPQTEEARAEAEILMQVQTQIMTPKNGYNIIGCVEDAVTGNYVLTKKLTISKEDAVDLLTSIGYFDAAFDKDMVRGTEVISKLFPEDFFFYGTAKQADEAGKETHLTIKKGKIMAGYIDDNSIGENNGELIREFYRKYGQEKTLILLGNLFKLGIKVLAKYGFTTTIADTDIPEQAKEKINELIASAYKEVDVFIKEFEAGKLEELPGKTMRETLEAKSLEILNKVRNKVGSLASQYASEETPTIIMARSGAKGNILNFTQISACVGQQALGGQRIKRGYRNRTLSLFKEMDLGPLARGFVKSSFKKGLGPVEFFFHAMTGRDALMDTALRTPKSGYLYRRLANALQDLKVEYDGTIRNARKGIIQFKYGDDGVDVSKSEGGKISVAKAVSDVLGQ